MKWMIGKLRLALVFRNPSPTKRKKVEFPTLFPLCCITGWHMRHWRWASVKARTTTCVCSQRQEWRASRKIWRGPWEALVLNGNADHFGLLYTPSNSSCDILNLSKAEFVTSCWRLQKTQVYLDYTCSVAKLSQNMPLLYAACVCVGVGVMGKWDTTRGESVKDSYQTQAT